MVDSIGFIEDLNPLLMNAFRTTLSELANSDLVLLFVDAGDDIETVIRKTLSSRETMQKEVPGVPILVCVNKIDIATREHLDKVLKEVRRIFETEEIIEISSKTGANQAVLLKKIGERLDVLN